MHQTRITVSAQDTGVQSVMDRLRQSATALSRQMIEDTGRQTGSAKEQIRLIEEQIRAIERRNRIDVQARRMELDEQLRNGEISERKHKRRGEKIDVAQEEDQMQVQLLRDIVSTLQENAREELRSDREAVEDRIQAFREGQVGEDLSPEEILRNRIQIEGLGGQEGGNEDEEQQASGKGGNTRVMAYGQQALQNITMSPNEVFALAAFIGMIPIIGSAISGLVNKSMQEGTQLSSARGRVQELTGEDVDNMGSGAVKFGVSMADFMQQYAFNFARAQGTFDNVAGGGRDALTLEKSLGVSSGVVFEMVKNLRQSDSKDFMLQVGQLIGSLQDSGAIKPGDFTQVEEYLQIANQLAATQSQTLDRVDMGINSTMIAEFAKLGGGFSNPEVLKGLLQTINSGVTNPQTQYAQAMQFAVMSRLNPNASRFELMQMQEQGMQNPKILQGVLSQLSSASGGNEDLFFEQIKAYFPQLSFAQTARMGRSFMSGELNLNREQFEPTDPRGYLEGRAGAVTSQMQVRSVEMDNMLAVKGEQISAQMGKLVDSMGGIDGAVGGILDTGIGILEGINKIISFFGGAGNSTMAKSLRTNQLNEPVYR